MSRKSNRTKRKTSVRSDGSALAPLLIVGGLLVLGVALIAVLSANRPAQTAGASTGGSTGAPDQGAGTPRVAVAQDTFDLGTVHFNNTVQTVFDVRNDGDRNLQILGEPRVELLEGC